MVPTCGPDALIPMREDMERGHVVGWGGLKTHLLGAKICVDTKHISIVYVTTLGFFE